MLGCNLSSLHTDGTPHTDWFLASPSLGRESQQQCSRMQRQLGLTQRQPSACCRQNRSMCFSTALPRTSQHLLSSSRSPVTSHTSRGHLLVARSQFDVDDSTVEKLPVELGPRYAGVHGGVSAKRQAVWVLLECYCAGCCPIPTLQTSGSSTSVLYTFAPDNC